MGAKTDLFPTFSELCADAREVGKKPLSIPSRPTDGKLVLDENFGIFPREFEEYTYSFLLFEAQKIERRLTAEAIASTQQESILNARRISPEQQMENDLHKFVSAREQASLDDEKDEFLKSLQEKKAPLPEMPAEVADYERDHVRPRESDDGDAPVPDEDTKSLPKRTVPPPPPAENEEFPPLPQAKPQIPPQIAAQKKSSSLPGVPPIPAAQSPTHLAQQTHSAKPSWQAAPKIPVSKSPVQDVFEPSEPIKPQSTSSKPPEPTSVVGAEKQLPAGISSYSKLSPRLQELIMQKLRREEEKMKKPRADHNIFKTPLPTPHEEVERMEDLDSPNAWNVHDKEDDENGADDSRDKGKKILSPDSKDGERKETTPKRPSETWREEDIHEPVEKNPRKLTLRKTEDESAPPPDEGQLANVPDKEEQIDGAKAQSPLASATSRQSDSSRPFVGAQTNRSPKATQSPRKYAPSFPAREEKGQEGKSEEEIRLPEEDEERPSLEAFAIKPTALREKIKLAKSAISRGAPDEEDDVEKEKQLSVPVVPEEKEEQLSSARSKVRAGPIMIKPLFPKSDVSGSQEEKQDISQAEDLDRMSRIQRIIEELSPDRMRVSPKLEFEDRVASKQLGAPANADDEEEKEPEMNVPVLQKPSQGKKSRASRSPLTKPPGGQEKKTTSAQEKEAPKEKQKAAPVKKLQNSMQIEELPDEETDEVPIARKPILRQPAREEEIEEPGEQLPAKVFPKLMSTFPSGENEKKEEMMSAPVSLPKRRILPGMTRTAPSIQQTYLPPAREKKQMAMPSEEPGEDAMQVAEQKATQVPDQVEISPRIASLKPKKLVSDEVPLALEKNPEQLLQEQKMAKMAEQLARLEAGKIKEVAGTATLPVEEEDVPLPEEDDGVPKPEEYGQAKESLRKSLEREEIARKMKQEDEVIVEQYAKDHLVWLYEIYKMGGMCREDFLQKASEKYSEAQNVEATAETGIDKDAPPNPALANLSREIEKKDKK